MKRISGKVADLEGWLRQPLACYEPIAGNASSLPSLRLRLAFGVPKIYFANRYNFGSRRVRPSGPGLLYSICKVATLRFV